jgi:flagellar protein FlaJ
MKFKKPEIMGVVFFAIILAGSFIFLFKNDRNIFYFTVGLGGVIAALPFFLEIIIKGNKEQENSQMFLEFARDLVESVKAGTPISKGIINLKSKNYGTLTLNIQKLANQISIGIPVSKALDIFANDVKSGVVTRSVMLIREAERAGGRIEDILDSVAKSVRDIEKLKSERKAAIYSLVMEGYIIFFVFLLIMLIMQFKIIPLTADITMGGGIGSMANLDVVTTEVASNPSAELTRPMFFLLLTQGFFAGLLIGKLSEGSIKSGIKHSFILMSSSILIYLGANAFLM